MEDHARAALAQDQLVAPPLLWSEVPSVIDELDFRGDITSGLADAIKVTEVRPPGLMRTAWELASNLGWAKTYGAEYLATAQLFSCRLVTVDRRLRRGADRLGYVVTPAELVQST